MTILINSNSGSNIARGQENRFSHKNFSFFLTSSYLTKDKTTSLTDARCSAIKYFSKIAGVSCLTNFHAMGRNNEGVHSKEIGI